MVRSSKRRSRAGEKGSRRSARPTGRAAPGAEPRPRRTAPGERAPPPCQPGRGPQRLQAALAPRPQPPVDRAPRVAAGRPMGVRVAAAATCWASAPAARRRIRHSPPRRRRPDPAPAAGHLRDHRTDGLGHIQPPGQRERRQQRIAHQAAPAPQPGDEDLLAAAPRPDMTPVPRPQHQRPGARRARRTGKPHLPAWPRHAHRPAAGTAIPWPRATPSRIPPRDRGQTTARRDPSHFNGDAQDLGSHRHSQAATSPKSTAEDPARMLSKSGRQQPRSGPGRGVGLRPHRAPDPVAGPTARRRGGGAGEKITALLRRCALSRRAARTGPDRSHRPRPPSHLSPPPSLPAALP